MIEDATRTSSDMQNSKPQKRITNGWKIHVKLVNQAFLNETKRISPKFELRLIVSKTQCKSSIAGIFWEIGSTRFFEALDQVSCKEV